MIAVREAAAALGRWRLSGCTVYVTLEPCPMCAGALHAARVDRCVYGAIDPKAGAVGTLYDIASDERLNHRYEVTAGVLAEESSALLKEFFASLRARGTRARAARRADRTRSGVAASGREPVLARVTRLLRRAILPTCTSRCTPRARTSRRVVREAEGARLEIVYAALNRIQGSNP